MYNHMMYYNSGFAGSRRLYYDSLVSRIVYMLKDIV